MCQRIYGFLVFLMCIIFVSSAQNNKIDSLKFALKKAKNDTTRCNILHMLTELEDEDDKWSEFNKELKNLCEKNLNEPSSLRQFYLRHLANAINNEGYLASKKGNEKKAFDDFSKGLKIFETINDKDGMVFSLYFIGQIYKDQGDVKEALSCYNRCLKLQKEALDKHGVGESLNYIGDLYFDTGNIPKALEYFNKSMGVYEEIKDKEGMAVSFNNLGVLYSNQGDNFKGIEFYQKSLKIYEQLKNTEDIAITLSNLGNLSQSNGDDLKAIEYYKKALQISEEQGYSRGVAISNINLGVMCFERGDRIKARELFNKSIEINLEINEKQELARAYNNLGSTYVDSDELYNGLKFYKKALAIFEEIHDKRGVAQVMNNISETLLEVGGLNNQQKMELLNYAKKSLEISHEVGFIEEIKHASELLSKVYSKNGEWKKAFEMHELYKKMSDSLNNEASHKAYVKQQFKYEYEKKSEADSLRVFEEKKVISAQLKQERTLRFSLYGGVLLLFVFGSFMFNRFRVTNKQKKIIEAKEKQTQEQKHEIEEKHKEITDSINYAERIQRSFLATKELLDENLKEYFVLFKPKDVVSGDFYWASKLSNGNFALVTADSTGHGVPGAIMSILNISCLKESVKEGLLQPAEILNRTRNLIIETLAKDGSKEGGKDGMDASLICFDFERKKLSIAAANNPVWIVRRNPAPFSHGEGRGDEAQIIEIKPDKMPIGKHDKQDVSFTQQEIEIQTGDVIYTLTDGFPDQFGGESGKKFMIKKLREYIASIAHLPMHQQKQLLEGTFANWVGNLEQVDDVCLIGVRI